MVRTIFHLGSNYFHAVLFIFFSVFFGMYAALEFDEATCAFKFRTVDAEQQDASGDGSDTRSRQLQQSGTTLELPDDAVVLVIRDGNVRIIEPADPDGQDGPDASRGNGKPLGVPDCVKRFFGASTSAELPGDASDGTVANTQQTGVDGLLNRVLGSSILLAAVVMLLPLGIALAVRIWTESLEKSAAVLYFAWFALAITVGLLAFKEVVYDPVLSSRAAFQAFGEGVKELFGFTVTLYAFLAGFILLYCLQEYSAINADFQSELNSWHTMTELLQFFILAPPNKRDTASPEDIDNDAAANECLELVKSIDPREATPGRRPEEVLSKFFHQILKLDVHDANDREALGLLIREYAGLRVLISQRRKRSIRAPGMLSLVLWIVSAVAMIFASLAVIGLFSPVELGTPVGRLVLALSFTLIVIPVALINLTIRDVRNPFAGHWTVDIEQGYAELLANLKRDEAPA